MFNIVFGVITLLLCCIGFWFSWKYFKKGKYNKCLLLIILCGLFLRIFVSTDLYLHEWDERYHALVAKNLMDDPLKPTLYKTPVLPYDHKNWYSNHVWLHKQPVPLWTMALSMKAFGVHEIALRLPSIVLSTLAIWLTFMIGAYLFNSKIGLLAAFFHAIHGLIIELTGGRVATDHIDIFFLFFIELAVVFTIGFIRSNKFWYNILAGISVGLAILCKWLPALIVLPIWLILVLDARKFKFSVVCLHFLILVISVIIIALPWQLYIFDQFPLEAQWESAFNVRHFTEALEGHSAPWYYYLDKMRMQYGELIYLPFIWFILLLFRKPLIHKRWALFIWIAIPYLFFSLAKTKMQAYTLFCAPAIFIILSTFWWWLYKVYSRYQFRLLSQTVLVLLIALPARYTIERIKPFEIRERKPQWRNDLKELKNEIRQKDNVILFNVERPIEAMFYTDFTAYRNIPDQNTISDLKKKGYQLIVKDLNGFSELETSGKEN